MASDITCRRLTVYIIATLLLQILGLLLFCLGFFPVKPALSGVSGTESFLSPSCDPVEDQNERALPPDRLRSLYEELSGIPRSFDRLILMVIDGLPAEFVLGKDGPPSKDFMEAMPYTQFLLANGMAIGYHAHAAPPTVTMPRLKAMVSGAIGGFLDVAFNFNTQAFLDDNLLGQFFSIGWKMVMLGDETWLKLFPGLFIRHDGVSSFFVKDTVQVDKNVSRHLRDELNRDDWDLLILHYLGLDHVGHVGGRNSFLMPPKLKEMDEVIKMIHLSTIQPQDNDQGRTLLMVVSDHGMTENGNHGGSSFEETDALALFIGLNSIASDYTSATHNTAHQVDIVPTLALLFGVPIPKNNVGTLIVKVFNHLTDDQQLRALELISRQLFRLLQAQLPGLPCGRFLCEGFTHDQSFGISKCSGSAEIMFCCLYSNAAVLHTSWKSKEVSRDDYSITVTAYYDFLRTASEWLSHRATDKPVGLLAFGVTAMILACFMLLRLLFHLCREVYLREKQHLSDLNKSTHWPLDETYIWAIIIILVISMGSSSMIEEEQYIWHFVTSTLYLVLLRKTMQFQNRIHFKIFSLVVLLISGRILRGWHQGGVNWTHLPDISKLLEQAGSDYIKSVQLVSGFLLISLSLLALSLLRSKRKIVLLLGFICCSSGLLVLQHIDKYQDHSFSTDNRDTTLMAQIIYTVLGFFTATTLVCSPWLMSRQISNSVNKALPEGLRHTVYMIGWMYISSWCFVQLLLQQPINTMPIFLLFVQVLASLLYYSCCTSNHKQWVEVAALYYLGMAGHFALGNTNTLATIDVAGAFIGISSHSTILSGILMFMITYASPMLFILSMTLYISMKATSCQLNVREADAGHVLKMMLSFPCLVPLSLNSILLTAYTILLLLMRNHLFVWSVFSPKYLYSCATTLCVYMGVFVVAVTGVYTWLVFSVRRGKM